MPGYKPQVKTNSGMVDIPIAATYDENGNRITKYVSTIAQTFTDEEKAQARANIGAAGAKGGKTYRHCVQIIAKGTSKRTNFFFDFIDADSAKITADTLLDRLDGKMMIVTGGSAASGDMVYKAVAFLVDSSRSSPYNVFSVFDSVTSSGVCYMEKYEESDVSQVNDYIQEMP